MCDEVCSLLCIKFNDDEKSGVVLGYFLYISQLISRRPKGLFFHLTMTNCSNSPPNFPGKLLACLSSNEGCVTQFPGQHSMAVISIILVAPAGCIGIAHNNEMPTSHKLHGGWHLMVIHLLI